MPTTLTSTGCWISAASAAVLAIPPTVLANAILPRARFDRSATEIALAAAAFWRTLAVVLVASMWGSYDTFFAPEWQRPLAPLSSILYPGIGLILWWLARRTPLPPTIASLLLGGMESPAEHAAAIWGAGLFEKVPMLAGVDPVSVLVFAFFEYVIYWSLTLVLARLLTGPLTALRNRIRRRAPS